MKEFVLIFRTDQIADCAELAEEEQLVYRKHWQDWFLSLAAQKKLAWPVQRWKQQGFVFSKNHGKNTNSPLSGLIFINASDYCEASEIARDSPVFERGGTVEVRMLLT